MLTYIYDGSFDGLLTAIHEAYYRRQRPERFICQEPLEQSLFNEHIKIKTDTQKSDKVTQAIQEKICSEALLHVYYAYLAELDETGTWIFRYLDLGWKVGKKLIEHLHDDRVQNIHNLSLKVRREKHRMLGLVRFRRLGGEVYYAPIEPDYNIVGLIAPHFAKRFQDQNWIIHDLQRGLGAVYNQREWFMTEINSALEFEPADNEDYYRELWQQYFNKIAIANRKNPALQRRCMPARYWKHLVEKN